MEVIDEKPPIYNDILSLFPAAGRRGVIFAWGDRIFNPSGVKIPPHFLVHEEMHGSRQNGKPETWWARYLKERTFRFDEEIYAHNAELQHLAQHGSTRRIRRGATFEVAGRLAGPLYNLGITRKEARKFLVFNAS
jgi:hypothetical protein